MPLKKNFINSFLFVITNIVIILIGIVVNYLIPLEISVVDYGFYRIFILLLPYFSLLHLGLIDGVYLNFKDKTINENGYDISSNFKGLIFIRLITSLVAIILTIIIIKERIIIFIIITGIINTFILNVSSYFNFISQATGNFKISNLILIITKFSFFIGLLIVVLLNKVNLYNLFIINILSSFATLIFVLLKFKNILIFNVKINWEKIKEYIKNGAFLMISNVLVSFILSIDKIISNQYISPLEFSNYAFAGAIITIIYQLASSISSIMFTYISLKSFSKKLFLEKAETLLIFLTGISLNFFIINQYIIKNFLKNYTYSLNYINMLLPSVFMLIIIQILHSTVYKVFVKTKERTRITFFVLIFEVTLLYYSILNSISVEKIIFIVNLSLIFWYILNIRSLRKMGLKGITSIKNIILIFSIIFLYRYLFSQINLYKLLVFNLYIIIGVIFYVIKNKTIIKTMIDKR